MTKKQFFGILYVSIWVIIWGSVGSLIDLPLLNAGVYFPGSIGQVSTFVLSAIVSFAIAVVLFSKASDLVLSDSSTKGK